jgi:hypothetical protein
MSKLINNGAFCVLPFIHRYQRQTGAEHFCCYANDIPVDHTDKNKITELKKKIYNGEKISNCDRCYKAEEQGMVSPRIRESLRWLEQDIEALEYIESWTEKSEDKILSYDLRYDNKCNLACIMCGPASSTMWAKELNVEAEPKVFKYKFKDVIKAKKIYMAGGEPFLIDTFVNLINAISKLDVQPELVINTNLTRVNDELKETLRNIKKLTLAVSVDAYESVNEYHRWPMKWDKLIDNLKWAHSIGCNLQLTSAVDAISILNMDQLRSIEDLVNSWALIIVHFPKDLMVENLPNRLKQFAYDNFINMKKSKFYTTDVNFKGDVDNILHKIMQEGNTKLLQEKIKGIDERRQLNHEDYLGVNLLYPE